MNKQFTSKCSQGLDGCRDGVSTLDKNLLTKSNTVYYYKEINFHN